MRHVVAMFGAWVVGCMAPPEPCPTITPLPSPPQEDSLLPLPGMTSPYLGQNGSWDGAGGQLGGSPRTEILDREAALGLRWTWMPVHWSALEPTGPTDTGAAWDALDAFVVEAHDRGLNIVAQPVVGGNAGGPPGWAGRRQNGRSAPEDMGSLVDFVGRLLIRYGPGGTLSQAQGWTDYGVMVWELDNEPDGYLTHWDGQAGDYAEFVTKASAQLRALDPNVVILGPALIEGNVDWLAAALDGSAMQGSDAYVANGVAYGIGPHLDVVSFHVYEWFDQATVECAMDAVRSTVERFEDDPDFGYPRKTRYWHTEGNYDFVNLMAGPPRAAWRAQAFARAFAAGIHKVVVKDIVAAEEPVVRAFTSHLPDPFPFEPMDVGEGVQAYRHPDTDGTVWVLWADNGGSEVTLDLPVNGTSVTVIDLATETREIVDAPEGQLTLQMPAHNRFSPVFMVLDPAL